MKTFKGIRGTYKILSDEGKALTVEYTSGEWKGRTLSMSKDLHSRMVYREGFIDKAMVEFKLDAWWSKYPTVYESEWKDGMKGIELLKILEDKYPLLAERVDELWKDWEYNLRKEI